MLHTNLIRTGPRFASCVAASASYDSVTFDVDVGVSVTRGISFSDDGTVMYASSSSNTGNQGAISQFDLSTAWDLSSAAADAVFEAGVSSSHIVDIIWHPDGGRFWTAQLNSEIKEYTASTDWDVTTGSFVQTHTTVLADVQSIRWNSNGTILFILNRGTDLLYAYSLSTAYDISTINTTAIATLALNPPLAQPEGIHFSPNGKSLYVTGPSSDNVVRFDLSTSWDLDTAVSAGAIVNVSSQMGGPSSVFISSDCGKLFVHDDVTDFAFQYSIST